MFTLYRLLTYVNTVREQRLALARGGQQSPGTRHRTSAGWTPYAARDTPRPQPARHPVPTRKDTRMKVYEGTILTVNATDDVARYLVEDGGRNVY